MSSDLTNLCRTCFEEGYSHYQLQDHIVEGYRVLEMLDVVVPQIHVTTESQFSNLICNLCVDKLLKGYKFQRLCIESDNHFRSLIGMSPPLRLLKDDFKTEYTSDPLLDEDLSKNKVNIEGYPRKRKLLINSNSLANTFKDDNDIEMQDGLEIDSNDTNSSDSPWKALKENKLKTSLKIGNQVKNKNSISIEFPCLVCGKIFYRLSHLKAHCSLHTKEQALTCDTGETNKAKRNQQSSDNTNKFLASGKEEENSSQIVLANAEQDSSQIFESSLEDLDNNEEWLSSDDNSTDLFSGQSPKKSINKPEHGKNIDFVDTGIGEIEKPNNKNRRNGNFPCEVCGKIFDRPFRLKRHSSVHSLNKPYACEICKCRFSTASYLKTHKLLHQNKNSEDSLASQDVEGFKCPDCPRRFEKQSSLSAHRQIHTRNAFSASYTCSISDCQRTFMSVKTLTEHVTNKHPDAEKYGCDQCDKSFVLHAHLLEHLNRHKGNKNLVCVICEKEFPFMSTLKEHMRIHSGESPYLCPECGKTFRNGSNLRQHMERHSGLKKYQCSECPSRFNCRSDLKKHIDTHNSIKSFECDTCGSRFTRSYSLQKHKRLHLGKRPYRCDHDQCNMSFALLYHLKRHIRTHTGEKPFKCAYCERAYGEKGDLNKHLRIHVGENTYLCKECPKAFKYQSELRQHQSKHYKIGQQISKQKSECFAETSVDGSI